RPVASKGSAAGPLHTSSVYDPRRDKPPAKADPKKRRYVNLTNEQLSLLINNEKDGVPSNLDAILMRMLSEVGLGRKMTFAPLRPLRTLRLFFFSEFLGADGGIAEGEIE